MAEPKIEITNPKALTKEEFDSLRGTSLYEQMFRNRSIVTVKNGLNEAKDIASKEVKAWLKENCGTFYYVDGSGNMRVYIEGDADAVNFKMRFHDQDIELPPPPPPKPAPAPAKPNPTPSFPVRRRPNGKMTPPEWIHTIHDYNGFRDELDQYDPAVVDSVMDILKKVGKVR